MNLSKLIKIFGLSLILLAGVQTAALSQNQDNVIKTQEQSFTLDTLIMGPELDIPWGMTFLPDQSILVTDRSGEIYHYNENGNLIDSVRNVPTVLAKNQGGLLDITLHPQYEDNGWIYITYSKPDPENPETANTALIRAKMENHALVNIEELAWGTPRTNKGHHFGSRIEFDKEGYLYYSIGDRGQRDINPQTLTNHSGKIHRLNPDGSIPADNPFVDVNGAVHSIYSQGHRNPQGLALDSRTGKLWEHEHAPRGGDEVNLIKKGQNYGWPEITYGINYDGSIITKQKKKGGMLQPIMYWKPSIAPCGMDFVEGGIYPGWEGDLLVGSLKFQQLERLVIENERVLHREILLENIGRVRNVKVAPNGYIYVAAELPGRIYKLIPVNEEL